MRRNLFFCPSVFFCPFQRVLTCPWGVHAYTNTHLHLNSLSCCLTCTKHKQHICIKLSFNKWPERAESESAVSGMSAGLPHSLPDSSKSQSMIKSLQSCLRCSVRMSATGNQSCFLEHVRVHRHTFTQKRKMGGEREADRCSAPKFSELPP